ncbi:MAG: hypothetical protein KGI71_05355 [Patescibacteria group bacterium]|nr:hypothetical protein [Patescibacteria group bacterium]
MTATQETLDLSPYRAHLEAALAYAEYSHTFEDIVALVASGTAQAWPGPASIIVTEIVDHPRRRLLHFFLAAGSLTELEAMTPLILAWGKSQGCAAATLIGRKGWARSFLTDDAWVVRPDVLMERVL